MKKTMMALAILAASAGANAGMYKACVDTPNQVPCEATAWDVGGEALVLQNTGSAASSIMNFAVNRANVNDDQFSNNWEWGFRIEGSYHYGTGNDFTVNWAHWKGTDSLVDTLGGLNPGVAGATFNDETRFDAINFELGQRLAFGENFKVRLHGGIHWGGVKESISDDSGNVGVTTLVTDEIKFDGVGPRVGIDICHGAGSLMKGMMGGMMDGLTFYAKGAAALPIGKYRFTTSGAGNDFVGLGVGVNRERTKMLPELDGSIGVKYTKAVSQGDLTAKVGWDQRAYLGFGAVTNATLSWGGVSFGLKWVGNA
jgi:hypothetical protein